MKIAIIILSASAYSPPLTNWNNLPWQNEKSVLEKIMIYVAISLHILVLLHAENIFQSNPIFLADILLLFTSWKETKKCKLAVFFCSANIMTIYGQSPYLIAPSSAKKNNNNKANLFDFSNSTAHWEYKLMRSLDL